MELPEPFRELGHHFVIDLPGARAVFSTRRGGHSRGPYASLNLGWLTDDEHSAVTRNRETLRSEVGAPGLSFVHQVHGSEVWKITAGTKVPREGADRLRRDGQATDRRDVALCALTADCLPIAVAGAGGVRAVAMLHAGWRGLATGMIDSGVQALRELGAEGELSAAIGPGAGACCYDVGEEVHAPFAAIDEAHAGRHLDLKAIARHQLRDAGVAHIADIGICTICSEPDLLFSHRRDHGITGRQAGVAWLT
jgi:purine-nucleoside/S-methyl-5'-thioadenosine phosphorylase / adenosine deaminase